MYCFFINLIINEPSNCGSLAPLRATLRRFKTDVLGKSARLVAVALALSSASAALAQPAPFAGPGMALDRPNVLGSVALAVAHTPLDGRSQRVSHSGVTGKSRSFATALRGHVPLDRIDAVNRYVNAHVAFISDTVQYRTPDRWSAASETLGRGRGDCEDYAIAKLQMLRVAGFADRDLYLVIVKDLVRRADHAVLVVRADGRMLLLDSNTDGITDATKSQDYRPVLSYSAGNAWTHGFQRAMKPVVLAAAFSPDQRRRSVRTP